MSDMDPLYQLMQSSAQDMSEASVIQKTMMGADDHTDVDIPGYGSTPSYAKQIRLIAQKGAPLGPQYATLADAEEAVANGEIPDGGYAYIRSEDDDSLADEYKNNAGTLQATGKSVPSQQAIAELEAFVQDAVAKVFLSGGAGVLEGHPDTAWAWLDAEGRSIMELLSEGLLNVPGVLFGDTLQFIVETGGGLACQVRGSSETVFRISPTGVFNIGNQFMWLSNESFFAEYKTAWMDAEGKIYKAQLADGSIVDATSGGGSDESTLLPAVAAVDGNIISVEDDVVSAITDDTGVNNTGPVAYKDFVRFLSDISGQYRVYRATYDAMYRARESLGVLIHVILTGQSLVVGGSTVTQAPITTSAEMDYGILAFATGPKVDFKYQSLDPEQLNSVIPCQENVGVRPGQESPSSGVAYQIKSLTGHTVLVSTAGSSGTAIADISAGSSTFEGGKAMVQAGVKLAEKLGLEYRPVLVLIHGNQNAAAGTSVASYRSSMESLRSQYQSVVRSATGKDIDLDMFIGQLSNIIPYGGTAGVTKSNTIAIAQYQEARDNDHIHLASAQYARPYSDGEHLTSAGYRTEGEVIGGIIGSWFNTPTTTSLIPDESALVQSGNTITIPVKGCVGALTIDTTRVTDPGNYGFLLQGATIASVSVSGSGADAKIIITKTDSSVATRVSYAETGIQGQNPGPVTGSRGCIRDSHTGMSLSGLPLYNDLAVFAFQI